jgi:hypothetical protein
MQSLTSTPFLPSRFCWICGKAVSTENCKVDEHENAVHGECYEARKKLNEAALSPPLKPKRMHNPEAG